MTELEQNIPAEMLDAAVEVMVRGEFTQPAANLVLQTANATLERIKLTAKIALEAAGVPALLAELAEYKASSDLRWNADQRAIQRWKAAHPDKPLTQPDHADLCVWLMAELETALTAAERGKGDFMNNKPNCETPTTTTCPPTPLPPSAMPLGSLRITPDRDAITENEPHGREGDE